MRKMTKIFSAVCNSPIKKYLYKIKLSIILLLCLAGVNSTGYAAPGYVLDPAFGDLGRVVSNTRRRDIDGCLWNGTSIGRKNHNGRQQQRECGIVCRQI